MQTILTISKNLVGKFRSPGGGGGTRDGQISQNCPFDAGAERIFWISKNNAAKSTQIAFGNATVFRWVAADVSGPIVKKKLQTFLCHPKIFQAQGRVGLSAVEF